MLEQRIQQQFFEAADLQYQTAESLSRPVAEAAQALVGCITAGGKVLVAGTGGGVLLAQHFAAALVGRFERDRPPLAALALRDDAGLGDTAGDAVAKQIQALGQPGDVLLMVHGATEPTVLQRAVQAAHAQDMTVVALGGGSEASPGWREPLAETDVAIQLMHDRSSRVLEIQLLVLHCLCDAVDLQLMGEQEAS